jgi:sugar (pentulose or hexulose) kinase
MMADVLGLPVRLGSAEETGALGGAMAAPSASAFAPTKKPPSPR